MLNKLIGERDWSAQEVSHLLLQLPVQNSSRMVVALNWYPEESHRDLIVLESGEVTAQRSPLQRYRDRLTDAPGSTALATLSLYECIQALKLHNFDLFEHGVGSYSGRGQKE